MNIVENKRFSYVTICPLWEKEKRYVVFIIRLRAVWRRLEGVVVVVEGS